MGTPIDPNWEYEEGNTCNLCWGVGKPFEGEKTPKYMVLSVTGVVACPPNEKGPPNGDWLLTQADGVPCAWNLITDDYILGFGFTLTLTECWIRDANTGDWWFRSVGDPVCSKFVRNWYKGCQPLRFAADGSIRVAWIKEHIPKSVLLDYNMNQQDGSFLEKWLLEDGLVVARYANQKTPMCVYIKYDSNLAEICLPEIIPA